MRASRLTAPSDCGGLFHDSKEARRTSGGWTWYRISRLHFRPHACMHAAVHTAKRVASNRSTRTEVALVHESVEK